MKRSVLVVAGEVSGDLHAAGVVQAVKQQAPDTDFWGIGGDRLSATGVELLQHTDRMSVMGFAEVLKQYRFFKAVFRRLLNEVDRRRPDVALLVDYPGFNLRLAGELRKRGIKVCYYISPKVWAWNSRRIPKMAKIIDRLMVVFPFEVDLFKGTGLRVDYVGNPLMEQIDECLATESEILPWPTERRIALLPGSRRQEIERILPSMLESAALLEDRIPDLSFIIATPNERIKKSVSAVMERNPSRPARLNVVNGEAREAMRQAEAAIVTSGTATLEAALIGTPHILVYKTSRLTYWFARAVLKGKHIGLVNIVAERTICPELIQHLATPESLADHTAKLMSDSPERKEMLQGFEELRRILGHHKAAARAADILMQEW